jgi:hypothetical protein
VVFLCPQFDDFPRLNSIKRGRAAVTRDPHKEGHPAGLFFPAFFWLKKCDQEMDQSGTLCSWQEHISIDLL